MRRRSKTTSSQSLTVTPMDLYLPVSGPNGLDPGLMTATQRLDEIALIMARAILRARLRQPEE